MSGMHDNQGDLLEINEELELLLAELRREGGGAPLDDKHLSMRLQRLVKDESLQSLKLERSGLFTREDRAAKVPWYVFVRVWLCLSCPCLVLVV